MKITKTQLRQIIKEELEAVIKEQLEPDYKGLRRMFSKGGAMPSNSPHAVRSKQNEKNGTFGMNNGYIGVVYDGTTYQWYGFDADENFDNSVLNGQSLSDAIESYGFRKGSVAIPASSDGVPLEYRIKHRDALMGDGNLKFPDQHERRGKPAPIYNPNVAPRY